MYSLQFHVAYKSISNSFLYCTISYNLQFLLAYYNFMLQPTFFNAAYIFLTSSAIWQENLSNYGSGSLFVQSIHDEHARFSLWFWINRFHLRLKTKDTSGYWQIVWIQIKIQIVSIRDHFAKRNIKLSQFRIKYCAENILQTINSARLSVHAGR